jgi:transposase
MRLLHQQIREIERERLRQLAAAPAAEKGPHVMVRLLARVIAVGIETADMQVNEILARGLGDRRAVARYDSPGAPGTIRTSDPQIRSLTVKYGAAGDAHPGSR